MRWPLSWHARALILRMTGMPWVPAQMWMPPFGSACSSPLPEHDILQRGVVGQHGVDDVAVARGVGDRADDLGARSASGFAFSGVRL